MADPIKHEGIVLATNGTEAHIRIMQASACAACHAKGACMAADAREKFIDCIMLEPMQEGDRVVVEVEQRLGWLAILLAFVLPFVWLVGMVWLLGLYLEEGVAGTLALCSLCIYFAVLALFRKRLKRKFSFTARRIRTVG